MLTCRGHGTNGFAGTASRLIAQMNRMHAASTAPRGQIQLCTCSPCCRQLRSQERADWLGKSNDLSFCKSLACLDSVISVVSFLRLASLGIAWSLSSASRRPPLQQPQTARRHLRRRRRHPLDRERKCGTRRLRCSKVRHSKPCPETVSLEFGKMLKKPRSTSKFLKTLECCI